MPNQTSENLPSGWFKTHLEEIAIWGSGGTPKRSESSYYGGDIPWVKTGDLGPKYLKTVSEFITELGVQKSSAKLFKKGSVALAMYGATIGKTSILDFDATTNQACAVGQPIAGLTETEFLYLLLKNEKQSFIDKGKGGAQPNISQQIIKAHSIGLPPIAEQKRIVEKLDSLLAQVNTIQQRLNTLPNIIKRFRQSVLAAAVSGKLTEQWREENQVGQWKLKTIQDVASKIGSGSTPKGGQEAYKSEGIPFIRSMNIHFDYIKYDKLAFIDEQQAEKLKNVIVNTNDVLLNITGASIGRVNTAPSNFQGGRVNQHVAIIRCKAEIILPEYLKMQLASPKIQKWIQNENYGATRQALTKSMIQNRIIDVPSMAEQTEIVRLVEQHFALADTLEKHLKTAKQRVDNLTQSILAKAFKGELVPQDPNDEPAEQLLARIKAARAEAEQLEKAAKKAARAKK